MNIKVKSVYCERLGDNITQQILARSFPVKTGYWISRAIEKIRQEAKAYFDEKNKLIKKHTDEKKQIDDEITRLQGKKVEIEALRPLIDAEASKVVLKIS